MKQWLCLLLVLVMVLSLGNTGFASVEPGSAEIAADAGITEEETAVEEAESEDMPAETAAEEIPGSESSQELMAEESAAEEITDIITEPTYNVSSEEAFAEADDDKPSEDGEKNTVSSEHRYQRFDLGYTWEEAEAYCESLGGHLMTISSESEQNKAIELLTEGTKNSYWLGGYRDGSSFVWIDGTSFSYSNWAAGEPNNYRSQEDRVIIYNALNPMTGSSAKYTWNDLKRDGTCNNEKFFGLDNIGFLCEWDNSDSDSSVRTISSSGFQINRDNNNFCHSKSTEDAAAGFAGATNYVIPDSMFNQLTRYSGEGEKNSIKKEMYPDEWGGTCYGIAMTMALLYEGYIDIGDLTTSSTATSYYTMPYPCKDSVLLHEINYYYLSQFLSNYGKEALSVSTTIKGYSGLQNFFNGYDSQSGFLKKLIDNCNNGNVQILVYGYNADGHTGGHAVLITGCEYDTGTDKYTVQIYDENVVDENGSYRSEDGFTYMEINGDYSGFSYGNLANTYTYMELIDEESLAKITSISSYADSNRLTLHLPTCHGAYTITNENGDTLTYDGETFSGTMAVYSLQPIMNAVTDDGETEIEYMIQTDDCGELTIVPQAEEIELDAYNDETFLAVEGSGADSAVLDFEDGVELSGEDYNFTVWVTTGAVSDEENGLVSVSGTAEDDVTISADGDTVTVASEQAVENLDCDLYTGTEVEKIDDTSDIKVIDDTAGSTDTVCGTCGESVTWKLNTATGVLTIAGSGEMDDYWVDGENYAPWYDYRTDITEAVIKKGVVNIGEDAFANCCYMQQITIPDSITSINKCALWNCMDLTQITIPDSVTSIGEYAFWNCRSLTRIDIPDSITEIIDYAFVYCSGLTQITIPDSVTSIGIAAFYSCTSLTQITIPESVTSINYSAFWNCTGLSQITIPGSVTYIGHDAFRECSALTKVIFTGDAPSIGSDCFLGTVTTCYYPEGNSTWTASVMQDYGGTVTWQSYKYLPGDLNGDNQVNIVDALRLFRAVNGQIDLPDAFAADLNGDGNVNVIDALKLFRFVNRQIRTL